MGRALCHSRAARQDNLMIIEETPLAGSFLVNLEQHSDERGFFARTFCSEEFAARGLATSFPQCSISWNPARGTLRGMHFQTLPHAEDKLVRCTRGAIFDVIVDLRRESVSRGLWFGTILDADLRQALFIPKGFAHGFLTIQQDTEVLYMMSTSFEPNAGRGFRWDDPEVAISWPEMPTMISERDANLPVLAGIKRE